MSFDPNHLNLNTTNATLIAMERKYCHIGECPESWQVIDYLPNLAGNLIYALCFCVLLGLQVWLGIRHKTWTYLGSMVFGLLGEIIGYIGRILLHGNPFINNYFLIYLICLTIAPAFLTACVYLCLGRIVTVVGPEYSRLKPRTYTKVFVGCDLLALVLQSIGGALASTARTHAGSNTGKNVMIVGLISQVLSIFLFLGLWTDFALRVRRGQSSGMGISARAQGGLDSSLRGTQKFRFFQYSLAIATVLILIRSIYRVAELSGGFKGTIANNEASFMILEGPFIITAVALMTYYHPGRVFGDVWVSAKQAAKGEKSGVSYQSFRKIPDAEDTEEMNPLRSRDPSPYRQQQQPAPQGLESSYEPFRPAERAPSPYRDDRDRSRDRRQSSVSSAIYARGGQDPGYGPNLTPNLGG